MCGLAGVAGPGITSTDLDNLETLLYISISRGPHSTGVATVKQKTNTSPEVIRLVKRAEPSWEFIYQESLTKDGIFSSSKIDAAIGHVRWATVGDVNDQNAHPFETDQVVGAHNGTLYNPQYRQKEVTDSELLFREISSVGIVDTLEGLSPNSAYAITMYDKGTGCLYFARNDHRTLWVGLHQKRDVLYWASEKRFLEFLEEDLDIYYFLPWKLYEVRIDDISHKNNCPWSVIPLTDKSKERDPYYEEIKRKEGAYYARYFRQRYGVNPYETSYTTVGDDYTCSETSSTSSVPFDYDDDTLEVTGRKKTKRRQRKRTKGSVSQLLTERDKESLRREAEENGIDPQTLGYLNDDLEGEVCDGCSNLIPEDEVDECIYIGSSGEVHYCKSCQDLMNNFYTNPKDDESVILN